tara:strand:- start:611 stop:1414 length:804 start_codon:yes stop_codon:yes gene_type:complete
MNNIAATNQNPNAVDFSVHSRNRTSQIKKISTINHSNNRNNNLIDITSISKPTRAIDFESMQSYSTIHKLNKNDMLIHEEDEATNFYEIVFGYVKTYKHLSDGRCLITNFLGKGDFVGLPVSEHYSISAQALTRSDVRCYSHKQIQYLMEQSPSFAQKILKIAQTEIAQATNQMVLLGRKSTEERIASFLANCEHTPTSIDGFESLIFLPMSLTDIADHLGLTQETVCREFKKLRSSGLLKTKVPRHQREIYVRDLKTLYAMAEMEK